MHISGSSPYSVYLKLVVDPWGWEGLVGARRPEAGQVVCRRFLAHPLVVLCRSERDILGKSQRAQMRSRLILVAAGNIPKPALIQDLELS